MKKLFLLITAMAFGVVANAQWPASASQFSPSCGSTTMRIDWDLMGHGCCCGVTPTSHTEAYRVEVRRYNSPGNTTPVYNTGWVSGFGSYIDYTIPSYGIYFAYVERRRTISGNCGSCPCGTQTENSTTNMVSFGPSAAAFSINGSTAAYPTIISTWTCAPVANLGNLSTNYTQYNWEVVRTNSSGTPLGTYSATSGWVTGTFSSLNLLTAAPGISTVGYYKVTVKVRSALCAENAKTAFFQVKAVPSSANLTFKVQVPFGVPVNPSNHPSTPVSCGALSVSMVSVAADPGGWSASDLRIRMKVQETYSNGNPIPIQPEQFDSLMYMGVKYTDYQPFSGFGGGSIPLNSITEAYFFNQAFNSFMDSSRTFKVTFEVLAVPCSLVYTAQTFINFVGGPFDVVAPDGPISRLEDVRVAVFPNPTRDEVNFFIDGEYGNATYIITDITGKMVMSGSFDGARNPRLDLGSFAAGMYAYELIINGRKFVGKIIRQ